MLRGVLERAGYDVVAVGSGADALAFLARTPPPCLIVLDIQMDDMSGWEVLDALPTLDHHDGFPVIVVSASRPRSLRGTPWLRKPVTSEQLLEAVRARTEPTAQAS